MLNDNSKEFELLERKYRSFRKRLPNKLAITAVNFFKRNFQVGGFVDSPFRKWDKRKNPRAKGKLMVKSGRTRRGIRKLHVSQNKIVVGLGNENKYAALHNKGGKIKITPKMRRFFWAKWYETGNEFWKNLALTKKTHLDIPQRKFIGDSKAIEKTIDRAIIKELKKSVS